MQGADHGKVLIPLLSCTKEQVWRGLSQVGNISRRKSWGRAVARCTGTFCPSLQLAHHRMEPMVLGWPGPSTSARAAQAQTRWRRGRVLSGLHSEERFCSLSLHFSPVSTDQTSVCFESEPKWPQRSEALAAGLWIVPGEPYIRHFASEGRAGWVTLRSNHSCGYKHSCGFLWWFKTVSHRNLGQEENFHSRV